MTKAERDFLAKTKFWDRCTDTGNCIEWGGPRTWNGYGVLSFNGKNWRAHRLAWTLSVGAVPSGLNVLHKCNNRRCVRIDHLYIGTQRDNVLDAIRAGTHGHHRARCKNGHQFSPENTYVYSRDGTQRRQCRTCHKLKERRRWRMRHWVNAEAKHGSA